LNISGFIIIFAPDFYAWLILGGTIVPYFITEMIAIEKISEWISEKLDKNMFLVDLRVSADNSISVEIDSYEGISIDACVEMSRHIESHLNRDEEDFALKVSSPGLGQYFKVKQQYVKNVGRELEIVTLDGKEYKGILKEAGERSISVEIEEKEKIDGQKKSQLVKRDFFIDYENINKARVVISFK
jgi:ribosome maturation factor RimP